MATKVLTDPQHYTNIANAIREKNGTSDSYTPADMANAILSIETGGLDIDAWYPSDTVLLFKHFKNGSPDINRIGFSDVFNNISDMFGGSICPYDINKQILLTDFVGTEGTITFNYSAKDSVTNWQRLFTSSWFLDGSQNQRLNIYARPNYNIFYMEDVSTSKSIQSFGTVVISFNDTKIIFYNHNYGSTQIVQSEIQKNSSSTIKTFSVGASGSKTNPIYFFNGYVWNVAYISRMVNESEAIKMIGK